MSPLIRAVALMLLGIVFLDIMSACIKALSQTYTVMELSAYRNTIGMLPSLLILWWSGELVLRRDALVIRQWRLGLARGVMVMGAQICYYVALGNADFALVAALGYTYALFMVAQSVWLLDEQVGLFRWGAVGLGFLGAMLILKPGYGDISLMAGFAVVAASLYALSTVTTRLMDDSLSTAMIYLYSSAAAAVCNLILVGPFGGFSPLLSWADFALIVFMALSGGIGVLLLLLSVRIASPSVLAPFNYAGLISAFVIGWLVFDEAPWSELFPGAILIVAAGGIVLWRDRQASLRAMQG